MKDVPLPPAEQAEADLRKRSMATLGPQDRQALTDLCEANGFNDEQIVNRNKDIKTVEMFLYNFPKMRCMQFFPNITVLFLAQQHLTDIEGLSSCPNLETVWLCEGQIRSCAGLEKCTKIVRLYLYSNKISKCTGLEKLINIEALWLNDNQITDMEGLETLLRLKELNLARNKIHRIGETLLPNVALTSLNLADNQIGSFREVSYIARMPNLRTLALNDPDWGENPVAALCNYQTWAAFTLKQLTQLDTAPLTDEAKAVAEATYMKKKIYYNMRMKTLRRSASDAAARASSGRAHRLVKPSAAYAVLLRALRDAERELGTVRSSPPPSSEVMKAERESWIGALEVKVALTREALYGREKELKMVEALFSDAAERSQQLVDSYVRRMMIELESGGNIRLEDGKPTDIWYTSCSDLVASRFLPSDLGPDVSGMRLVRVTRIHNRFLRARFESRLEQLADTSDASHKRALEYLFCGEAPAMPGELMRAAEEGFRDASWYGQLGLDHAVPLTNSVALADLPRLAHERRRNRPLDIGARGERTVIARGGTKWTVGRLLVAKVFLGRVAKDASVPAGAGEAFRLDGLPGAPASAGSRLQGLGNPTAPAPKAPSSHGGNDQAPDPLTPARFPKIDSVYRSHQHEPKQRMWYIFDRSLVLPEYMVEFEYELRTPPLGSDLVPTPSEPAVVAELARLNPDLRPLARPFGARSSPARAVPAPAASACLRARPALSFACSSPPCEDPLRWNLHPALSPSSAPASPRDHPHHQARSWSCKPKPKRRPRPRLRQTRPRACWTRTTHGGWSLSSIRATSQCSPSSPSSRRCRRSTRGSRSSSCCR